MSTHDPSPSVTPEQLQARVTEFHKAINARPLESPSVSLGPISSPLMWPPGIPVVAAVEWRAPKLKPESEWNEKSMRARDLCGPGPSPRQCSSETIALLFYSRRDRVSVRVSP